MKAAVSQSAAAVAMVRPRDFASNIQTAETNELQAAAQTLSADERLAVQREFAALGTALAARGVDVLTFDSPPGVAVPDAVFPNNWFSTHADGSVLLYPMHAPNRRLERQPALLDVLTREHGYRIERCIDLSAWEVQGEYVEGTGSLVFDHVTRIAYAAFSARTTARALQAAAEALGFRLCAFNASHASGKPIYHTNVMLSVGSAVAIGCFDSVRDSTQRERLLRSLQDSGKQLIQLSEAQMLGFAANVLELRGSQSGVLAISSRAWNVLTAQQRAVLETTLDICTVPVDTIERIGGGGVRCMLAEIHLPKARSPLS